MTELKQESQCEQLSAVEVKQEKLPTYAKFLEQHPKIVNILASYAVGAELTPHVGNYIRTLGLTGSDADVQFCKSAPKFEDTSIYKDHKKEIASFNEYREIIETKLQDIAGANRVNDNAAAKEEFHKLQSLVDTRPCPNYYNGRAPIRVDRYAVEDFATAMDKKIPGLFTSYCEDLVKINA